jgi:hypothetical protein
MENATYEWMINGDVIENDTDNAVMFLSDNGTHTITATIDGITTQLSLVCDDTYCMSAFMSTS